MRKKSTPGKNIIHMDKPLRQASRPADPRRPAAPSAQGVRQNMESLHAHMQSLGFNRTATVVAGGFFVLVMFYLIYSLYVFWTTPEIPVERIQLTNVEVSNLIEGIIIRDETVYRAPQDGVLQFYVNEFERLRPGIAAASVQNIDHVADIRRSITAMEAEILRFHELRGDILGQDPVLTRIDRQIQNLVNQRLSRHIRLNMTDVYALRNAVVQNVNTRNQMIVSLNMDAGAGLGAQQDYLYHQLSAHRAAIAISRGGVITPIVDGLEAELTFGSMLTLTREQTRQTIDFNTLIQQREVSAGDAAFKIVNSNIWYIAAYAPNRLVEGFQVGEMRRLFIDGHSPVAVRVERLDAGFAETFVLFRATHHMIDFLDTRNLSFRVSEGAQLGIVLPRTAIVHHGYWQVPLAAVHEGENRYVVLVTDAGDVFLPLVASDQCDDYVYVAADMEMILEGDVLRDRTHPETLTHTVTRLREVLGVFRVNNGIAVFLPVILTDDLDFFTDEAYIVLDPALNPGLRLNDHVVSNAANIRDGQIVFSGVR